MSASVSISVDDFAEDIKGPILPILDALGLIGGTGDDLDLAGWNFQKAIDFIKSYERTSSLLTILDFLDPEVIPPSYKMYRDDDGHVTSQTSPSATEEIWQPLLNFNETDYRVDIGVTHKREMKDEILSSNDHCQTIYLGLFAKLSDVVIKNQIKFSADISLPILRSESSSSPVDEIEHSFLLFQDVPNIGSNAKTSIQLRIEPYDTNQFQVNTMSCDAIILRLAIGRDGLDVELNLENFTGPSSPMSQDMTIGIASAGDGFNPDFDQLLNVLLNSIESTTISNHLLPILGLDSSKSPSVPEIGIISLLMNMNNSQDLINGIKSWALEILTNSQNLATHPIENWFYHAYALFTGNTPVPVSDFFPGSGTYNDPWDLSFSFASNAGVFGLHIWMETGVDGTTLVKTRAYGDYELQFNSNNNQIHFALDLDLLSIPLFGQGTISYLDNGFVGLEVTASDDTLFDWNSSSSGMSANLKNALGNLDGSVEKFRAGLNIGPNLSISPELALINVQFGASSRDIDLLSGGLTDELANMLGDPFRNALSDLLVSDPYLQRIGALLGLVCPRNNGSTCAIRDIWEGSGSDLRIGGITNTIDFIDFINDPLSTIGRYHNMLLESSSISSASGSLSGIRPWTLIAEAIADLIQSVVNEIQGAPPVPIRTDGSCSIITDFSTIDSYIIPVTPTDAFPRVELEFDYDSASKCLSLHPVAYFSEVSIGSKLALSVELIVDIFSINLPDCLIEGSTASEQSWLSGARLNATLQSQMVSGTRPAMQIIDFSSLEMTIQSIVAGLEWEAPNGSTGSQFGYNITINDFIFDGEIPDLQAFFALLPQGFDFSQIDGLSWDGLNLHFPDLSFICFRGSNKGWWNSDGSLRFSWPDIDWNLGIEIPGLSISLPKIGKLSFTGWNIPSLSLNSLNFPPDLNFILRNIFPDLPDLNSGGSWDLRWFLELPSIRMLIGKFIGLRCGKIGFFFSGFFKIDPMFPHLNLGSMLRFNGFEIPKFNLPEMPDAWKISLGLNSKSLGLGPFTLPIDWPEINWPNLMDNPFGELKRFFMDLFNGRSKSGEPFALPTLRWLWGLFTGKLPDLRLPDFGWGDSSSRTGQWWDGFNWGGINWGSINWPSLNWGDFNWGGLNWGDLNWGDSNVRDAPWGDFDWGALDWGNLNWDAINWPSLNWQSLQWGDLDWPSLNWGDINWNLLDWRGLNSGDSNWNGFDWDNFDFSGLNWNSLQWNNIDWSGINWSELFGDWWNFSSRDGRGWSGFDWGGINWGSINWPSLNWGDFNWGGLNWKGLNWGDSNVRDAPWGDFDWGALDWGNLNWGALNWPSLNWQSLQWGDLEWPSLNWEDINWNSLNWRGLNSGDSNWNGFDWDNFDFSGLDWSALEWNGVDWSGFNWSELIGGFSGFKINLPPIPLTIVGNGTYENPWAVSLNKPGFNKFQLLFWLDPDGLPRLEGIPEVFNHLSDEIMDVLDIVLAIDSPALSLDWAMSLGKMLGELGQLDARVAHAIGGMSDTKLGNCFMGLEAFIKDSDGLISLISQKDGNGTWATNQQASNHEAHHLNVLKTTSVIQETSNFISSISSSTPIKFLFVSPSWLGESTWNTMQTGLESNFSIPSNPTEVTDLSGQGILSTSQIQLMDLTSHDKSKSFHLLIPNLAIPTTVTYKQHLENQIAMMVDHLTSDGGCKVFLAGHSVGGLAVRYYSEGGPDTLPDGTQVDRDNKVCGVVTYSTPHDIDSLRNTDAGESVLQVMQLLRLIGTFDPSNPPEFDPDDFDEIIANAQNEKNISPDLLKQLATILLETAMKTGNPEGSP